MDNTPDVENWGKHIRAVGGEDVLGRKVIRTEWENVLLTYTKDEPDSWGIIAYGRPHSKVIAIARMSDDAFLAHVSKFYTGKGSDLKQWVTAATLAFGN